MKTQLENLENRIIIRHENQDELSYIWDILSSSYAGFAEMQEKGFSKKKLMAVKDSRDFHKLFSNI